MDNNRGHKIRNENAQSHNLKKFRNSKRCRWLGPLCIERVALMAPDLPLRAGGSETVEYLQDLIASIR